LPNTFETLDQRGNLFLEPELPQGDAGSSGGQPVSEKATRAWGSLTVICLSTDFIQPLLPDRKEFSRTVSAPITFPKFVIRYLPKI
jgi:hypothetical protein